MRAPAKSHEHHAHQILTHIHAGEVVSQRSLASSLGIALGLTNLLVRRLVRKGWVRAVHIQRNRVKYLLTPAGIAEKTRMSRRFFLESLRYYLAARDRIRERLAAIEGGSHRRILFYGAGELAEVAYICLQETGLELVGVVDEEAGGRLFGVPVRQAESLRDEGGARMTFDAVLVTSSRDPDDVRARLEGLGLPVDQMHWIL